MQPHQERVVTEKEDLDGKLSKLTAFFDGTIFLALDGAEQGRLREQAQVMRRYSEILGERIAAF